MDNKKLPEKLLKQEKQDQDQLKQSYFMAYNAIFAYYKNFSYFIFFCGESENKKINKSYIYRLIIMNILI